MLNHLLDPNQNKKNQVLKNQEEVAVIEKAIGRVWHLKEVNHQRKETQDQTQNLNLNQDKKSQMVEKV